MVTGKIVSVGECLQNLVRGALAQSPAVPAVSSASSHWAGGVCPNTEVRVLKRNITSEMSQKLLEHMIYDGGS